MLTLHAADGRTSEGMTRVQTDTDASDNDVRSPARASNTYDIRFLARSPSNIQHSRSTAGPQHGGLQSNTGGFREHQFDDRISARARTHMIIAPDFLT